jgi:hypothetical protein
MEGSEWLFIIGAVIAVSAFLLRGAINDRRNAPKPDNFEESAGYGEDRLAPRIPEVRP